MLQKQISCLTPTCRSQSNCPHPTEDQELKILKGTVKMEADFHGYASKADVKCIDGVTIVPGAFQHQDKEQVPLVWQHSHNTPANVLGHAILENRTDGTYAYCYFNESKAAKEAKELLKHGDIKQMSIWANELTKRASRVIHGMICEVSLVLKGANPGAMIDPISIRHGDMIEDVEGEAIITTGLEFELAHAADDDEIQHASGDDDEIDVEAVYNKWSDEEKDVVHYMIGAALEAQAAAPLEQSAIPPTPEIQTPTPEIQTPEEEGQDTVSHNVRSEERRVGK